MSAPDLGRLQADMEGGIFELAQMARLHQVHVAKLLAQGNKLSNCGNHLVELTSEERDMLFFATDNLVQRSTSLDLQWQKLGALELAAKATAPATQPGRDAV